MSSLALTLLCCCSCMLALASGLPITSKPLDNSPDHLTWEAAWLSGDSRIAGAGGKAKKITPKSIFIAPQLNGFNGSLCPPDTRIDYNGKCIQVVNINTADILVTKLQSILGNGGSAPNTGGDDDYDYDYDPSGPFQVNLPLSIDLPAEQPSQQFKPDTFYDTTLVDVATTVAKDSERLTSTLTVEQQPTFLAATSNQPFDQTAAESHTDISFLTFESLPNGTLSTQLEVDGNNGTVVQKIILTSTSATPTTTTMDTAGAGSTTATSTSTMAGGSTDATSTIMSTTEEFSTSSTDSVSPTETGSTTTVTVASTTEEKQTSGGSFATTTQQVINDATEDDLDGLKSELAEESLMLEATGSTTTDIPSIDITDDADIGMLSAGSTTTDYRFKTTTSETQPETSTMRVLIHTIPPTPPKRIRPSPKPVQIVTPVRTKWYSPPGATPPPFIVASYTQQERTTRATPETTTVSHDRSTETPLLVINDTEADKKNRDTIHRQELKDKLSETLDTNNRFVYHHLPSSSFPATPPPASTTTAQDHNYVEQLKKINEIVAENKQYHQQQMAGGSRIRFPTRDEDQTASATNHNVVRFPGSVSNRLTQNANRLPDIFPKKTPDSTTQRPPFWWLPSGWEVDQTGQKPMLLRFWSRMPLVRDQSLTTSTSSSGSSSGSSNPSSSSRWRPSATAVPSNTSPSSVVAPRGNSKSPSENFYKEVSSQDIYKVLNMRQLKHKR